MPWGETEHGAVWMVSGRMGAAGLIPVRDFFNAAPFGDLENFLEKLGCKVLNTY